MRVALAQINPIVGDLEGNVARCLAAIQNARMENPDLVVLPEMAVPGYPPRDILYDTTFTEGVSEATRDLARRARGCPPAVVGTFIPAAHSPPGHPGLYNIAVLIEDGKVQQVAAKRLLPGYDVFYEPRWFLPGPASAPTTIAGVQIGFMICEDMWDQGYDIHPGAELKAAGAEMLVCISAAPYRRGVLEERLVHARRQGLPLVHVNLCGANDELIFDGRSFAINQHGELIAHLAGFNEDIQVVDIESAPPMEPPDVSLDEERFNALVLGVRDFAQKNHMERAFLGLSGGIDSSVVGVIAAHALGPERVTGIAIPSRYTDPRSTGCAHTLADNLGIAFEITEHGGFTRSC